MGERSERRQRKSRHASKTRLETEKPRKACRNADRSAAVRAETKRTEASRNRRRRPAGRTAGRLLRVPRVARHAGKRTVGRALPAEFGCRCLSDQDRTRFAKPRDRRCVAIPILVGVDRARAAKCRPAFRQQQILHRHGHAIEWRKRFTFQPAFFGRLRHRARDIAIDMTEGIDLCVERLDAREAGLGDFKRRQIARCELRRQFRCGQLVRFPGHGSVDLGERRLAAFFDQPQFNAVGFECRH